jgi:asparagine synthase (glutamine-hydrolysing)
MCGIAGIVSLNDTSVYNISARLERMKGLLKHRGPDQYGFYISDDHKFGLFNNRLAIVGVKDTIELPLRTQDSSFILTFNGELYNHKELRQQLRANGTVFSSKTDTEVLLNGLVQQGNKFLQHIDGMWGFAFVDRKKHTIHLSRDVMGEKPVYYLISKEELIFCSEVAPIVAVMREEPEWNDNAIVCSFQNRSSPPGETLISQIKRLRGGETLTVDYLHGKMESTFPKKLNIDKWRWFFDTKPPLGEVLELYDQEIYQSCMRRFPGEVKFISTLSGGIDSALINVMLSNYGNKSLDAIHALSEKSSPRKGKDLSELEAAKYTAKKLKINLTNFSLYDSQSLSIYQEEAADSFDGVFCEGVVSFRLLAKRARLSKSKVLVLSDGPDELLNGYDTDARTIYLAQRIKKMSLARQEKIKLATLSRINWAGKSQKFLNWTCFASDPSIVRPNHGGTTPDLISAMVNSSFKNKAFKKYGCCDSELFSCRNLDDAQSISASYLPSSIPDYINTRSDRGTMKEGIETRLPFLSTSVVELFMSTPERWRLSGGGKGKTILRHLVEKNIGPQVSNREKYGFSTPIWQLPNNQKKLGIFETIRSSDIFDRDIFQPNVKGVVLAEGNERLLWMAYSLAMTAQRLKIIRKDKL